MFDLDSIRAQSRQAAQELLAAAHLAPGSLLVVGCSSSEITGGAIGKASSPETAQAVFQGIYPLLRENDIFLAAQCCEHLNRALILEAACAERYGYEPVSVRPQPKAGGEGAHPGPCGAGHRRYAHRDAPAGRGCAGEAEPGPHRERHPAVRPDPAQIHRRQPRLLRGRVPVRPPAERAKRPAERL